MTVRLFFKTGDKQFTEKESIELEFRPIEGDVLHYQGNRYQIRLVEYGAPVNGKQTISAFLTTAPAAIE